VTIPTTAQIAGYASDRRVRDGCRRIAVLQRDEARESSAQQQRHLQGPSVAETPKSAIVSAIKPISTTTGSSASSSEGGLVRRSGPGAGPGVAVPSSATGGGSWVARPPASSGADDGRFDAADHRSSSSGDVYGRAHDKAYTWDDVAFGLTVYGLRSTPLP
jgi:hypothetical protein